MVLTSTALARGKRMTSCGSETLHTPGCGLGRALCYCCISRSALDSRGLQTASLLGQREGSPLASVGAQDMPVAKHPERCPAGSGS